MVLTRLFTTYFIQHGLISICSVILTVYMLSQIQFAFYVNNKQRMLIGELEVNRLIIGSHTCFLERLGKSLHENELKRNTGWAWQVRATSSAVEPNSMANPASAMSSDTFRPHIWTPRIFSTSYIPIPLVLVFLSARTLIKPSGES